MGKFSTCKHNELFPVFVIFLTSLSLSWWNKILNPLEVPLLSKPSAFIPGRRSISVGHITFSNLVYLYASSIQFWDFSKVARLPSLALEQRRGQCSSVWSPGPGFCSSNRLRLWPGSLFDSASWGFSFLSVIGQRT